MADIETKASDRVIPFEVPAGAPEVEPSRRASVHDTIAAINAELARHEPSIPATRLTTKV